MKNIRVTFVLFLLQIFLSPCFVYAKNIPEDVIQLQKKFLDRVEQVEVADLYEQKLVSLVNINNLPKNSQYFLLVDRSSETQTISLAFLNVEEKDIVILGTSKVSTGNPLRRGFFETPVGIFKNTPDNMSYRALGTKNSKGWRGLGAKGSRVWDLGWQKSKNEKNNNAEIRMLIHASDPDQGEKRLGKQDSKGCIRLSAKFNYFLDHHSILDAEYENNEKKKYILPKDREKVPFQGSLIVVVDSTL